MIVQLINRTYTPRTARLLSEYLSNTYPNTRIIYEPRLILPNPAAIAAAGGDVSANFGGETMGYPDAIVFLSNETQIWEAKNNPTSAAIGQLQGYKSQYLRSTLSAGREGLPLTLHLLVASDRPALHPELATAGISLTIYSPAWYSASVAETQATSASNQQIALRNSIIESVLNGVLTDEQGIAQLVALGETQNEATDSIAHARATAQQAAGTAEAS